MNWNELHSQKINEDITGQILTDVDCPKCGRKIYLDNTIILTSYPEKYRYWCPCGWEGYSHVKWIGGGNK